MGETAAAKRQASPLTPNMGWTPDSQPLCRF